MKTVRKLLLAVTTVLTCFSAMALPVIQGGISLGGGYATDTGNLNTAHSFTAFNNVIVASVSGSYASVPLAQAVTMNPFSFNPFPGPGVSPLWTFVASGATYSFDLLTLQPPQQPGDNTLTLRGTGTLKITGFENTGGTWLFTANQGGGTFSFSSSNAAGVPDSGMTLAMLGFALVGLATVRRKLSATT